MCMSFPSHHTLNITTGVRSVRKGIWINLKCSPTRMATEGIIEPCHDPMGFNSSVFTVRKKNGTIRVVAYFKRILNKVLVDLDPYPMPRIDQLFHKIGQGNKYFTTLDLHSGYWQIEIDDRDRYKTAFTWKDKCYQYTRLAFGLTSAGQIFSRCVAEVLASVSA